MYVCMHIPLQPLPTKWSPHPNNLLTIGEELFHEIKKYKFLNLIPQND